MRFFQMKMNVRILISMGLFSMLLLCCTSDRIPEPDHKVWTVKEVPVPAGKNNAVSDPDHLLSPSEIELMNEFVAVIRDSAKVKIKIVIVEDIGNADIHVFAKDLFRYWDKGKEDYTMLMFVATDQLLWSYESGSEARVILPEIVADKIAEDYLAPTLRDHKYSEGITDVLYIISKRLNINTGKAHSLAYQLSRSPLPKFRIVANWLMVVYFSIVFLIYNHKRKERSFAHLYFLSYADQQAKVLSYISFWQWAIQYILMPLLWLGVLYIPETAEYPAKEIIKIWVSGVYIMMLCWLTEHRLRVNRQLMERTKDDPALLYTRFLDSHKGWAWSTVFFPFPFLLYYIWYGRKVERLRNQTRPELDKDK